MLDAHSRRQAALDVIEVVLRGARARDQETESVDFKEEAGTVGRRGRRQAISAEHESAARALAGEAACMANGDGGVLVVGVDDSAAGKEAFVGTYLDTEWLRRRIYALTQPSLAVDVIEQLTVAGKRIYLINVAPSLEEIWCEGKLRARFGTDCEELTGDRARWFLERRRRYDWSSEPSGLPLSQALPDALRVAHQHYEARQGRSAGSDLALARRLGVSLSGDDDPELNRAGALLLCRIEPDALQLDVLVTRAEGAASERREQLRAPLITAFDSAWEVLTDTFRAELVTIGAQRRSVRAIPDEAMREAVVNGLMHRDYDQPRTPVAVLAIGDPATILKVTSPGGFPPGIEGTRLLAARSRPRNPALANAMRVLGLAEAEGVGISTMFRLMLRDGHPEPEISEDAGAVICRLPGGRPDSAVRRFFDELERRQRQLGQDVRVSIAIHALLLDPVLRPERLATAAQCTEAEAMEALEKLADVGAVERLLNRSQSFRLTNSARADLAGKLRYKTRQSLDHQWDLVRAYLDTNDAIGSEDAAQLLGVRRERASRILSTLYNQRQLLEPMGSARGRGVRYRASRRTAQRR
jgi:ATP-dependent DNA helicase RecG